LITYEPTWRKGCSCDGEINGKRDQCLFMLVQTFITEYNRLFHNQNELFHNPEYIIHYNYNSIWWCTGFILIFVWRKSLLLTCGFGVGVQLEAPRWILAPEKRNRTHRSGGGIGLQTLQCPKKLGRKCGECLLGERIANAESAVLCCKFDPAKK
jgi:hypothetical protein